MSRKNLRIHEKFETGNENFAQKNERSLSEVFRTRIRKEIGQMITVQEYKGHIRNWAALCEELGVDETLARNARF